MKTGVMISGILLSFAASCGVATTSSKTRTFDSSKDNYKMMTALLEKAAFTNCKKQLGNALTLSNATQSQTISLDGIKDTTFISRKDSNSSDEKEYFTYCLRQPNGDFSACLKITTRRDHGAPVIDIASIERLVAPTGNIQCSTSSRN